MIFFEPGRRKACRKRLSNFLARLLLLLYAFSHLNNMKNRGSRGVSSCGEQRKRGRERMDRWMDRWERGERSDRPVERVRAGGQRYAYRHTQRHAPNLKFKFGTSHGTASYTGYSHARARAPLTYSWECVLGWRRRRVEEKREEKEHPTKRIYILVFTAVLSVNIVLGDDNSTRCDPSSTSCPDLVSSIHDFYPRIPE